MFWPVRNKFIDFNDYERPRKMHMKLLCGQVLHHRIFTRKIADVHFVQWWNVGFSQLVEPSTRTQSVSGGVLIKNLKNIYIIIPITLLPYRNVYYQWVFCE